MRIYLPMTTNILTAGHIKVIEYCYSKGDLYIGLLTPSALKGYKKEITPYEDRKYILESLNFPCLWIVPQYTLNPTENVLKYECDTLASGDGFEPSELECINRYGLKKLEIKLKGESKKQYSSSSLLEKFSTG